MNETTKDTGARFTAGAIAGVIAGIVMAMIAMSRAAFVGMSFWFPVEQIAATFYGVDALLGGGGPIIVGVLIHMVTSAVLGGLAGLFLAKLSTAGAFGAGLLVGVVIWALMTFLVLPIANEVMRERVALMSGWWFTYHLVFGGMLFLTPVLFRRLGHRPVGAAPPRGARPA